MPWRLDTRFIIREIIDFSRCRQENKQSLQFFFCVKLTYFKGGPEELELELIQNPNDTEASAAGSSIRACVARKSKTQREECLEGRKHNTSIPSKVETVYQIILKPDLGY